MTYTFRPAVRANAPLLIGLAGGTGSGKTYSALRLAKGLVGPGEKIAMIDTEKGRGLMYADEFDYLYEQIEPPFRPEKYMEAMAAAVQQGAKCIIVDSTSHEWEGIGGLLEWANSIAENMAQRHGGNPSKYTFGSWKEPKIAHQKWVQFMLNYEIHVILCFRAKEKKGLQKDERGRQEVVNLGWTPITDKDTLPYEMTFLAMFTADEPGVPKFTYKALTHKLKHIFPEGQQIGEEHGRLLREWASASPSVPQQQQASEPVDYVEQGRTEARKGRDAFLAWWNGPGKTNGIRAACKPHMTELQKIAEEADAAQIEDEDPFAREPQDEDPFGDKQDAAPEPSQEPPGAPESDAGAEAPETPAETSAPSAPSAPIYDDGVGILDENGSEIDRCENANKWYFALRARLKDSNRVGDLLTQNNAGHLHWQASNADPSHKKQGAEMWANFLAKAGDGQEAA